MTAEKPALIIGIDLGAKYSAAAWCYTVTPQSEVIRSVRRWPGSTLNVERVPTALSYQVNARSKTNSKGDFRWGFEAKSNDPNPCLDFLLLLDESYPIISSAQNSIHGRKITPPAKKTPADLITDYMTGLITHVKRTIDMAYPCNVTESFGKEVIIEYCITISPLYCDLSKSRIIEAVKTAIIGQGQTTVRLISTPEAAAVYYFQTLEKKPKYAIKVGDLCVFAHCGGETVDVRSYEIKALGPLLCVAEVTAESRGFCGSNSVDNCFKELLERRLKADNYNNMSAEAMRAAMDHFCKYLKLGFMPSKQRSGGGGAGDEDVILCPLSGIPNGYLPLTEDELISVFHPSFEEITNLVKGQIQAAEAFRQRPVTSRVAGFSYGVVASEPFDENIHPYRNFTFNDRSGELMCRGRMLWFLEKGQEFSEKEPMRVNITTSVAVGADREDFKSIHTIYCCDAPQPPKDVADERLMEAGVIVLLQYEVDAYDIPRSFFTRSISPVNGEEYWSIPVDIVMHWNSTGLMFWSEVRASSGNPIIRLLGKSKRVTLTTP
ncbi:hypothetical protein DFH27DRAFT_655014 [Peziza echinospora]|nr:hypothetical protein DFH27DRAFT_655014 [Peziza echinospora]